MEPANPSSSHLQRVLPTVWTVMWSLSSFVLLVMSARAKEACSSEVGSVPIAGSAELLLPCDLVGWLSGIAVLAGLMFVVLAVACGAQRQWPTAALATASGVVLPCMSLFGLGAANLL